MIFGQSLITKVHDSTEIPWEQSDNHLWGVYHSYWELANNKRAVMSSVFEERSPFAISYRSYFAMP